MALTEIPIELSSTPGIVDNSNTTAITIDDSENATFAGNVGIGRDPRVALDVAGEVAIAYNATYGLRFYNQPQNNWSSIGNTTTSSAANLVFKDSTGEVMRIESGRVGIGSTTVNRKLEVAGNNNGGAKANYIRITDTDTTATANNQAGGIEFFTNDVTAGIAASIEVLYAGTGGGGEITFNTNASSSGTLTEALRIDESGNVGIGQAPSAFSNWKILELKGGTAGAMLNFENSSSTRVSSLAYDDGSDSLRIQNFLANPITFETNNTERLRIDSAGNVGIGTSSPSTPLTVAANSGGNNLRLTGRSSDGYAFLQYGNNADNVINAEIGVSNAKHMLFFANSAERMRIDGGTGDIILSNQIHGGFGAVGTGGTLDWNHVTNARSGMGYTLLVGTATNGMGGNVYYHVVNYEYGSKNGTGNLTQIAIPYYGTSTIYSRNKYQGVWSSWGTV